MPIAAIPGGLAPFQTQLVGRWENAALPGAPNGEGSKANPLSYNVMPLPQLTSSPGETVGYILKNSGIWEIVTFPGDSGIASPTTAPNRGDDSAQAPTALYYEQQVHFADGPGANPDPAKSVVHTENGAWLHLATAAKIVGPYGTPVGSAPVLDNPNKQPPSITIAKQMSIPHGNSILALGSYTDPISHDQNNPLMIPDAPSVFPTPDGLSHDPYLKTLGDPKDYQNPRPDYTANPHLPVQVAVGLIKPTNSISWSVTTKALAGGRGSTVDIPFEQRSANVSDYEATYWLMSTDGGTNYDYLAYVQNITLQIPLPLPSGTTTYVFPHITSNVVTRQDAS